MLKLKQKNSYFEEIKAADIWQFSKISSKTQRRYYSAESLSHPAKMPTPLAQKIIMEYTAPGDLILDPMAGIGTTLIEACLLSRNAIGVELESKFVQIANQNIANLDVFRKKGKVGQAKIIQGDSTKLSEILSNANHIIFSPPFSTEFNDKNYNINMQRAAFGEKRRFYSTYSPGNIALSGKNYLDSMFKIYQECFKVLNKRGRMVLVTKNPVKNKELVRLDLTTIKLCEKAGFKLIERKYRQIGSSNTDVSFWVCINKKHFYKKHKDKITGDPYPVFEDVLVFQKRGWLM